jgi:hypothetical protein
MGPVTNPRPLSSLLDRERTRSVQPVTGDAVKVVTADPDRSYFVVFSEVPAVGTLRISPDTAGRMGVSPIGNEGHVLIDSVRFPLLAQQEWYINSESPGPTPIHVIEVRRTSGE